MTDLCSPTCQPWSTQSHSLVHARWSLCGLFADAMPVYDMIEYQMVRRNIPNGWISRLIYRSIYVVIVAFVAVSLPFFGSLLGFIGERSAPPGNASMYLIVSLTPLRCLTLPTHRCAGAVGFGPTTFTYPPCVPPQPTTSSMALHAVIFCGLLSLAGLKRMFHLL